MGKRITRKMVSDGAAVVKLDACSGCGRVIERADDHWVRCRRHKTRECRIAPSVRTLEGDVVSTNLEWCQGVAVDLMAAGIGARVLDDGGLCWVERGAEECLGSADLNKEAAKVANG